MTTEHDSPPAAPGTVDDALACVTVSFRSTDALVELVQSLETSTVLPARTVIVNNAPDDPPQIQPTGVSIDIVEAGRNLGYGSAVNLGVRQLDESIEWVLITNPDVRLDADALEQLLSTARSLPLAGALGPLIRDNDGIAYPSARELPSLRTGIGHALFATVSPRNPWTKRYRAENRPSGTVSRRAGWLSGSCLLVRRAAFDAIGGFDESYFMYFEDVDLGKRLTEAGWQNVYTPSASVVHTGAHSTSTSASAMRAIHHRSAYQYLARKYSAWYLWPLRAVLRIGLAARSRMTRGA
ncbi:MAG: glycosyltransferase family 2 protein [Microbacteriaceae bacterium]|nr:MAG: glycosyltransferase family 2 protein [Microbacteriaceae bacterium]